MTEIVLGVHVVPDAQGVAGPGGALNLCLLVEPGRVWASSDTTAATPSPAPKSC
jgi:repressor of nif and glnA expression